MRSGEKGVTLVELIIALGLVSIVFYFIWNFMIGAIKDSGDLGNKMAVQDTVNQLMNNLQRDVQEASLPISSSDDLEGIAKIIAPDGDDEKKSIILKKPENVTVTYEYDPVNAVVTYTKEDDGEEVDTRQYENITEFIINFSDKKNGLKATVSGRIDETSNHSLTNEFFTRNTM